MLYYILLKENGFETQVWLQSRCQWEPFVTNNQTVASLRRLSTFRAGWHCQKYLLLSFHYVYRKELHTSRAPITLSAFFFLLDCFRQHQQKFITCIQFIACFRWALTDLTPQRKFKLFGCIISMSFLPSRVSTIKSSCERTHLSCALFEHEVCSMLLHRPYLLSGMFGSLPFPVDRSATI